MSTVSNYSSHSKKSRGKRWEAIKAPPIEELELLSEDELRERTLSDGFCVRFFRHDMLHLFTVPSHHVRLTRGVLDYLHDYSQLGPNKSRNRLYICSQFEREGQCINGSLCREVHCTLNLNAAEDASRYGVPSNATGAPSMAKCAPAEDILQHKLNQPLMSAAQGAPHAAPPPNSPPDSFHPPLTPLKLTDSSPPLYLPENLALRHSLHSRWTSKQMYHTLPPGVPFNVALPNTPTPVDTYDSSELFVTRGAVEYYTQSIQSVPSTVTMQHCAHYSKNGVCCFGEDCQFVHVLHYSSRDHGDLDGSSSDVESSACSSANSNDGSRRRSRRANGSKQTPLYFEVPATAMPWGESPANPSGAPPPPQIPTPAQPSFNDGHNTLGVASPAAAPGLLQAAPGGLAGNFLCVNPAPWGVNPPQQSLIAVQGPNGNIYLVQPPPQPMVAQQQPMYMMPMPAQQLPPQQHQPH